MVRVEIQNRMDSERERRQEGKKQEGKEVNRQDSKGATKRCKVN